MNARSVKNFSTFSIDRAADPRRTAAAIRPAASQKTSSIVALLVCLLTLALLAAPVDAKKKKKKKKSDPQEMFNLLLGIDYSHWLVGPVAYIATPEEIEEYLALVSDEDAQAFIETFWKERAEGLGPFDKKPRDIFEARAQEADQRYFESAIPGRSTDRGAVFIVWGEPEEIEFETPEDIDAYTQEVWTYNEETPPGLDGEPPKKTWRFVKIDGETVLYAGQKKRDPMSRVRRRTGFNG